jgi:hypothetical protein
MTTSFQNATSKKLVRYNKDGQIIEDTGPLRDGEYLRIQMTMMDANNGQTLVLDMKPDAAIPLDPAMSVHQRGYRFAADTTQLLAQSETSYAERKQRLSQAWLYQQPKPAAPPLAKMDEAPAPVKTDIDSLLDARDTRLTEAWRNPPPLALTTTDTSKPANVDPAKVTAADVDAAIERRNARLESAWKVPA